MWPTLPKHTTIENSAYRDHFSHLSGRVGRRARKYPIIWWAWLPGRENGSDARRGKRKNTKKTCKIIISFLLWYFGKKIHSLCKQLEKNRTHKLRKRFRRTTCMLMSYAAYQPVNSPWNWQGSFFGLSISYVQAFFSLFPIRKIVLFSPLIRKVIVLHSNLTPSIRRKRKIRICIAA